MVKGACAMWLLNLRYNHPHMNIGGFVSSSGGLYRAIERADQFGFTTAMVFIGAPQSFKIPDLTKEQVDDYKRALKASQLTSVFAHALYLANMASPDSRLFHGSVTALTNTMIQAEKTSLNGVIFHLGSHKKTTAKEGLDRVIKGIKKVLEGSPGTTKLLLENAVKQGDKVGVSFEELGYVLSAFTGEKRLGVCIDTCHAFASGTDFSDEAAYHSFVEDVENHVGFDTVECFHLNDSKGECGSHIDRHANIGEGFIGEEGFRRMLSDKHFSHKPFILEVPGVTGNGPSEKDRQAVLDLIST